MVPESKLHQIIEKAALLPQALCPISHYFAPGVYVRQMVLPAGVVGIGRKHRHEHVTLIQKGRVALLLPGNIVQEYAPPDTFTAPPGHKVFYALEDTVFVNVHPNPDNIRDLDVLQEMYVDDSVITLPVKDATKDIEDFKSIEWNEVDEEFITLPRGFETAFAIKNSPIHGLGLYSYCPFSANEYLIPYRIMGKLTVAGRYINHSAQPNAAIKKFTDDEIAIMALTDIIGADGSGLGEEITIDYREVIV